MDLKTPLINLAGIGPAFSSRLKNLNLKTVEDLMGEAVAKMGENIKIGRFSRFQIK